MPISNFSPNTTRTGFGRCTIFAVALLWIEFSTATGAEPIDFSRDVRPILQARCESCHGTEAREGGLRFFDREDLFRRNDSGAPAVVAGSIEKSELLRRITATTDQRMPPEGTALTADQIQTLTRWIAEGAIWTNEQTRPAHWAYIAPQRPVRSEEEVVGRISNPIDAFVLHKLKEQNFGLQQSPVASPAKLLRRVHLDLVGLAPSPEQTVAFENDPSYENYQRIVEELLESPRYGEKWARQWLDLARYADSNGFQADQFREIWAFRDYVISAFNADLPFDQFTIEQIAGDLLPDATLQQQIATGFQRCTTCNVEAGVDPEENRTQQIIDRVNTVGTVWLGTTLECAQCHNHKYDPFTQEDYYQIFAFFNNTPLEVVSSDDKGVSYEVAGPKIELPLDAEVAARYEELKSKLLSIEANIETRLEELQTTRGEWEASLTARLKSTPEWHVLTPVRFTSTGGANFEILADQSVLLSGTIPDKDRYTVLYQTALQGITGFKIETLTDPTLPGQGPGRGDEQKPNFVVNEISLHGETLKEGGGPIQPIELHTPQADFSQARFDVSGLIDENPDTAWAINPQFHKPHWASFLTSEPFTLEPETVLNVTIDQQYGGGRTIGRFRFLAMTGEPGSESIPDSIRQILLATSKRTKPQLKQLGDYQANTDTQLIALKAEQVTLNQQIKEIQPVTSPVMMEMETPRPTYIFKRGNFLDLGASVEPQVPSVLHRLSSLHHSGSNRPDRLAFARWLVSRENPLVARAAVNRWWSEFFGHGIVASLEDLGTQGDLPTHPELLDWLAVEFMDHNWSMKHVHRQIVLSETYRQDSIVMPEHLELDVANKWYARGPRLRMSAEMIRDHALNASGVLSTKMGGPPVYPPQPDNIWRHVGRNAPVYATDLDEDRYRRGIYVVWRRSAPYPSFVNFDAPDRGTCVVNRSRTNTPLQALTLLNDPAYVELARALARHCLVTFPKAGPQERLEYAFLCVVNRPPTDLESELLLRFFESARSKFSTNEKLAAEIIPAKERIDGLSVTEHAAYFELANILLNLDETITKN